MDPGLFRILVIVALIFFIAGDFTSVVNPVLKSIATFSSNSKKTQPTRTGKSPNDLSTGDQIDDEKQALNMLAAQTAKNNLMATIRNACLPKLVCELNAAPHREHITEAEKALLSIIRDTSISTTAEVTSKYHFAAHMGQLIAGVDGTGCHNFYPTCPFPGNILQMFIQAQASLKKSLTI